MMYHKLQSETNSEKKGWVTKDSVQIPLKLLLLSEIKSKLQIVSYIVVI